MMKLTKHTLITAAFISLALVGQSCLGYFSEEEDSQTQTGSQTNPSGTNSGTSTNDYSFSSWTMEEYFGYFNTSKWNKADGWSNEGMFNCGWNADHVSIGSNCMTLKLDNTSSSVKSFTGGEYRTNDNYSYGMYEVKMVPAKTSGIVSSFFLYTDDPVWDEIDIEFLGKDTTKVQFNYFVNGIGKHEYLCDLGFDASLSAHTYAIEYKSDSISWYVDGIKKHTVTKSAGKLPSHKMQIMMNLWNGIGVDSWLGPFWYSSPLYARYYSVKYKAY